jgi:acyl-CoA thioesterase FadM/phosphopantetheinyl transferase
MAQAAAHVTGQYDFDRVRIEKIQLKRPITVDPDVGADIVVWAEVAEPENPSSPPTINAGVYKQGAGQGTDYFSATFVLGLAEESAKYDIDLPGAPLDIRPKEDLYDRKILFQGPRFQRLQHIYALDSKQCVFKSEFHAHPSGKAEEQWLLGDPYFRDSLLHSTQLPVSQHICLPVSIESIKRFPTKDVTTGALCGETVINNLTEEEVHGSVVTSGENGQMVEQISGYVAKIVEFHEDYPSAEEIVAPRHRDEMIISDKLKRLADLFGIFVPAISSTYFPGLKELTKKKRHSREASILKRAAKQFLEEKGRKKKDIKISWLETGKPVVDGGVFKDYDISLSHNRGTVLSVAGEGPQGCDIESITKRSREEWIALLGNKRATLLETLVDNSESIDKAGTRIWSVLEAVFKAYGSRNIDLKAERKEGDNVLFRADEPTGKSIYILTFPLVLTLGRERMLAISCQPTTAKELKKITANDFGNIGTTLDNDIYVDSQGRKTFVHRFPLNFKETQGASGGVYFTNYFDWFGRLREAALTPIMKALRKSFETGKWGLVTKNVELAIYSDANVDDMVESRLWLKDIGGKNNANIQLGCEWYRVSDNGKTIRLAEGDMMTGWVEIKPDGIMSISPLPGYLEEFINTVFTRVDSNLKFQSADNLQEHFEYGAGLYRAPNGNLLSLGTEKVQTSQEHSTPLRNIYFSNFAKWQGQALEKWLYERVPDLILNQGSKGELKCLITRVNYLREAMVFDEVHVTMYLKGLFQNGVKFVFDFNRIEHGKKEKLASSEFEVGWVVSSSEKTFQCTSLPTVLRNVFLDFVVNSAKSQEQMIIERRCRNFVYYVRVIRTKMEQKRDISTFSII